jgi:uncharacterized membrane protein YdjX (TVP38/TMEM64 family)
MAAARRDLRLRDPKDTARKDSGRGGARLVLGVGLLITLGAGLGWLLMSEPEAMRAALDRIWLRLQQAPAPIYFGVVSIAILLPLPASIFYIAAGPLYGVGPSIAWIPPVLIVNTLLVHALSATMVRPLITRVIARRGLVVPTLEGATDQNLAILLVRITPGVPYFLQSWLLGLAGVDRLRFVVITVPIQMVYASGFVVLGRSAFEGEIGVAIAALAVIVVAGIAARIAHRRLRALREPGEDPGDG